MTNPASFLTRCWRFAIGFARPELMIAFVIIGAALTTPSVAMQGDTIADRVLEQVDFVHNGLNLIDATGMLNPEDVAIDSSVSPNRLYVADTFNSRVLDYKNVTTFVNGGAADLVIGQPTFCLVPATWVGSARPRTTYAITPASRLTAAGICTSRIRATAACLSTTLPSPDAVRSHALEGPPTSYSGRAATLPPAIATAPG
jgi:hypothetical protein